LARTRFRAAFGRADGVGEGCGKLASVLDVVCIGVRWCPHDLGSGSVSLAIELRDCDEQLYRDNREVRTFCPERHKRSQELPHIVRTLERRRCEFARGYGGPINYVTVETTSGDRYAVFFDLRRLKKAGANAVHLMVQSAYVLDPTKAAPGRGRITFQALLSQTLRGTNPQPPP
jgi:hypothetical protein